MKIACAYMVCLAFAGISRSNAQEVHDTKKDRTILDGYIAVLTKRSTAYFYGLYVDHYFSPLDVSDSTTIKRFLSTPNGWSDQRSIMVSRIPDLDRLNNLKDTVLVYGPRSMAPFVRGYVPPPQPVRVASKRRSLLSWFANSWLFNSIGYSPYRVAYGRWYMPYATTHFETNPNSLPFYMTQTNTNKYLLPFDK